MTNLDQEAFITGLSGELELLSYAESAFLGLDLRQSALLAEQQIVSTIFAKVFAFIGQLGQFLPPASELVALIDKAIDAAIVALAQSNPLLARILGSPIVRDRLRAAILSGLESLFPAIEV